MDMITSNQEQEALQLIKLYFREHITNMYLNGGGIIT